MRERLEHGRERFSWLLFCVSLSLALEYSPFGDMMAFFHADTCNFFQVPRAVSAMNK